MNPSSFASVPQVVETVNTNETLTISELKTALAQKNREAAQAAGRVKEMAQETARDLESRIKKAQAVETVNTCPECWLDTDAVVTFFGRELCPTCAEAEEDAFDAAQCSAWEEMDFARHDQMSSMGSVLAGMGF